MIKGKIYKMTSPNYTYYGCTINSLKARLAYHKYSAIYRQDNSSYKLFEDGDVEIHLVLEAQVPTKKDLKELERFYIENNECVNTNIPSRTMKEYDSMRYKTQERKDYLKNYNNRIVNCDFCNKELRYSSLSRHKPRCIKNPNVNPAIVTFD